MDTSPGSRALATHRAGPRSDLRGVKGCWHLSVLGSKKSTIYPSPGLCSTIEKEIQYLAMATQLLNDPAAEVPAMMEATSGSVRSRERGRSMVPRHQARPRPHTQPAREHS